MKKGIIFDMDGTLWDSAEIVAKSWDRVIQEKAGGFRRITTEDIRNVMGLTMTQIGKRLFPDLSDKEAVQLMQECCRVENEDIARYGGVLYPDLENTLQILAEHYPLYIVSNCQKGYIEAFLSYYKFERYFLDTECFGNNSMDKAYNIRLIMMRNHLEQAVYVGDIQADYESSMQAGADFIHASYGFGSVVPQVPAIRRLTELPAAVSEVFGDHIFV